MTGQQLPRGRFAPSPTGRMHLGNIFTALISWLSARKAGGKWVLRIEDLDPQRSRLDYARLIEDDLSWLGLDWDEGGVDGAGPSAPYMQSMRSDIYEHYLTQLHLTGLTYPCRCTRADIRATQAPHQTDGRIVYAGTCRPASLPSPWVEPERPCAVRIAVPDREIEFTDTLCGAQSVNLSAHCGDFVLRRADKAWAYQLAVVVDDALMGITEVVRGNDLLLSTAQQLYLYSLLRLPAPAHAHLPLVCNAAGQRLSKRDSALSMESLRLKHSPHEIIGKLAWIAGITDKEEPCSPTNLISAFSWEQLSKSSTICLNE